MSLILKAFADEIWAITEPKLTAIAAFLQRWERGIDSAWRHDGDNVKKQDKFEPINGNIAVLPVYGVISRRMNMMTDFSGGTSIESLSKQFDSLVANDSISTIILSIDSPGGAVSGVPEFAQKVYKARSKKQIIALCDSGAESAGYWIASAAESIVMAPSAYVGSVGVYRIHVDESKALDKEGVKYTFIKAGKYKVEGNSTEAIDAEGMAYMQSQVDDIYSEFVDTVARNRGVTSEKVKSDYGEGRSLRAKAALKAGIVDRVATLDEVIKELTAKANSAKVRAESFASKKAELAVKYPNVYKVKK